MRGPIGVEAAAVRAPCCISSKKKEKKEEEDLKHGAREPSAVV
jgi:hypothetical protein